MNGITVALASSRWAWPALSSHLVEWQAPSWDKLTVHVALACRQMCVSAGSRAEPLLRQLLPWSPCTTTWPWHQCVFGCAAPPFNAGICPSHSKQGSDCAPAKSLSRNMVFRLRHVFRATHNTLWQGI